MKDLFKWSAKTRLVLFSVLVVGLTLGLTGCFGLFGTPPTAVIVMEPTSPSPGDDVTFDVSDSKAGGTGDELTSYTFTLKQQSPGDTSTTLEATKEGYSMDDSGTDNWTNIVVKDIQTGEYKASLTVEDGEALDDEDTKEFDVN